MDLIGDLEQRSNMIVFHRMCCGPALKLEALNEATLTQMLSTDDFGSKKLGHVMIELSHRRNCRNGHSTFDEDA